MSVVLKIIVYTLEIIHAYKAVYTLNSTPLDFASIASSLVCPVKAKRSASLALKAISNMVKPASRSAPKIPMESLIPLSVKVVINRA